MDLEGAPDAELHLAPKAESDLVTIIQYAAERQMPCQIWGGGTHSGYGSPVDPAVVISLQRLNEIETWEPDDMTIVVGAGALVAEVEERIQTANQTLGMEEHPGVSTIGGQVASGANGLRRGRLYSTRERLLECTVVTGDGRIVRSGGRVVKNVTGYDLHRLSFGAFGSLGVVTRVCLKLWPTPSASATVTVSDIDQARLVTRPLAVLEHGGSVEVFLWGTEEEVGAQADRLGGTVRTGHDWPVDPEGDWRWSLRVPPSDISSAAGVLPEGWDYLAIHGVGEVRLSSDSDEAAPQLRQWAEAQGGSLVKVRGGGDVDPWGAVPPAVEMQRRLVSEFDPRRIINPGRLPGGV